MKPPPGTPSPNSARRMSVRFNWGRPGPLTLTCVAMAELAVEMQAVVLLKATEPTPVTFRACPGAVPAVGMSAE